MKKSTLTVILKRIVAGIGIFISLMTTVGGLRDFDAATNGLDIFKAIFWILIGTVAMIAFVDDFRNKKWPFEGSKDEV